MFSIVVRFDLRDEDALRAFDALTEEVLVGIQEREPGTLVYAVHTAEDAPLSRVFYEVYTSREAHAQHEANEPRTACSLRSKGSRRAFGPSPSAPPTGKVL